MLKNNELLDLLKKSNYSYKLYEHQALFTVNDSVNKRGEISGSHSKNLFLKNKKNKFFLFTCLEQTKVELKKLAKKLELGNISFANEVFLLEYLGVKPGSVTPFGLLNDQQQQVEFYLDKKFLADETANFHPLTNTQTINIKINDFINFLKENNKKVNIFDFESYSLI